MLVAVAIQRGWRSRCVERRQAFGDSPFKKAVCPTGPKLPHTPLRASREQLCNRARRPRPKARPSRAEPFSRLGV